MQAQPTFTDKNQRFLELISSPKPIAAWSRTRAQLALATRAIAEASSSRGESVLIFNEFEPLSGLSRPCSKPKNSGEAPARGYPIRHWARDDSNRSRVSIPSSYLNAEFFSAVTGCSDIEDQQLRLVFSVANEQQRSLTNLRELQGAIAWAQRNRDSVPSWHGSVETTVLEELQEKILNLMSSSASILFPSTPFHSREFSEKDLLVRDYSNSGVITIASWLNEEQSLLEKQVELLAIAISFANCFEREQDRNVSSHPRPLNVIIPNAEQIVSTKPLRFTKYLLKQISEFSSKGIRVSLLFKSTGESNFPGVLDSEIFDGEVIDLDQFGSIPNRSQLEPSTNEIVSSKRIPVAKSKRIAGQKPAPTKWRKSEEAAPEVQRPEAQRLEVQKPKTQRPEVSISLRQKIEVFSKNTKIERLREQFMESVSNIFEKTFSKNRKP